MSTILFSILVVFIMSNGDVTYDVIEDQIPGETACFKVMEDAIIQNGYEDLPFGVDEIRTYCIPTQTVTNDGKRIR